MAKFLTGTFCWFGRPSFGRGGDQRIQFEKGSFDHLKDQQIPIFFNHEKRIGTGRIQIQAWGMTYEMPLEDDNASEIEGLIKSGKIKGSSFTMASYNLATKWDRVGYYDSVRRVSTLFECGPSVDPAERWTSCSIIERSTVAASKPMADKRQKQRMNVPQMPQSMLSGIALMNAAIRGESAKINGRTIDARTVAALVSNAGPMSIR